MTENREKGDQQQSLLKAVLVKLATTAVLGFFALLVVLTFLEVVLGA